MGNLEGVYGIFAENKAYHWCGILLVLLSVFEVKSLQLVWKLGTSRFHLRVPNLQMSCSDMTAWQDTRRTAPSLATATGQCALFDAS